MLGGETRFVYENALCIDEFKLRNFEEVPIKIDSFGTLPVVTPIQMSHILFFESQAAFVSTKCL